MCLGGISYDIARFPNFIDLPLSIADSPFHSDCCCFSNSGWLRQLRHDAEEHECISAEDVRTGVFRRNAGV